jgi:cobalt-precorrin-5B (C1)-methyltransferase
MSGLRTGYSTGACAAGAAKAAALALSGTGEVTAVDIPFPDGTRHQFPVAWVRRSEGCAEAAVRKDAGDDPDVIHGSLILASVQFQEGTEIKFAGGEGIGTVTKPGLQVPPGEPAVNPAPRKMIWEAVREVTARGVQVTLSIPGGCALALRTFNPRLGIVGGLSIIGTSGYVRPFSVPALRVSLKCALDIAASCGVRDVVLAPGNIGERAARHHFRLTAEQVVQVSNEWGYMLEAARNRFENILLIGHPGKLAKLADGGWDTHSARSASALAIVLRIAATLGLAVNRESPTVEGLFEPLQPPDRLLLGNILANAVRRKVEARLARAVAVLLPNMNTEILGADGDLSPWR